MFQSTESSVLQMRSTTRCCSTENWKSRCGSSKRTGLVSASSTTLRLTEAGESELDLAESRYWHDSWTKLRNRLERLGTFDRSGWTIEPAQFNAAVGTYLGLS